MRPLLIVKSDNFSITRQFYRRLISAVLTDNNGEETDTLELTFDDRDNAVASPKQGAILEPLYGYQETGVTSMGRFVVTRVTFAGGTQGETVNVTAEAVDFRSGIKERQSEHFDDTTLGAMLETVFSRHDIEIRVDPDLASIPIDYEARFNQSAVDFATRLAERYNAVAKPVSGGYAFVRKGKAASSLGAPLAAITVRKRDCESWSFEIEPRPRHGKVAAKWFDRNLGRIRIETVESGGEGPMLSLPHTYKTQDEARRAAQAEGTDANRKTGSGSFTFAGRPELRAEADVNAEGFRPEINGLWRATSLTHEFNDRGYINNLNVEAPEQQKRGEI